MKIIAQEEIKERKTRKEGIRMRKALMLSLVIGILLAIAGRAFAFVEEPLIIDKN